MFWRHSLRSASNQMHSLFSAFFRPRQLSKYLARLRLPVICFGESFAGFFFTLSTAHGSFHASPGERCAMRGSVRGQSVGAAEDGSSFLSLRALLASLVAEPGFLSSSSTGPCQRALPNPSIERTCPGKPGHASHLKR